MKKQNCLFAKVNKQKQNATRHIKVKEKLLQLLLLYYCAVTCGIIKEK
jgi:hypothetical protein